jgi:hypothetical protein
MVSTMNPAVRIPTTSKIITTVRIFNSSLSRIRPPLSDLDVHRIFSAKNRNEPLFENYNAFDILYFRLVQMSRGLQHPVLRKADNTYNPVNRCADKSLGLR